MKTAWNENGEDKAVTSPLSLVISAFGAVKDIRKTLTPQLRTDKGASRLLLLDLGEVKIAWAQAAWHKSILSLVIAQQMWSLQLALKPSLTQCRR